MTILGSTGYFGGHEASPYPEEGKDINTCTWFCRNCQQYGTFNELCEKQCLSPISPEHKLLYQKLIEIETKLDIIIRHTSPEVSLPPPVCNYCFHTPGETTRSWWYSVHGHCF